MHELSSECNLKDCTDIKATRYHYLQILNILLRRIRYKQDAPKRNIRLCNYCSHLRRINREQRRKLSCPLFAMHTILNLEPPPPHPTSSLK